MIKVLNLGLYSEANVLTESERTVMSHEGDPLPAENFPFHPFRAPRTRLCNSGRSCEERGQPLL